MIKKKTKVISISFITIAILFFALILSGCTNSPPANEVVGGTTITTITIITTTTTTTTTLPLVLPDELTGTFENKEYYFITLYDDDNNEWFIKVQSKSNNTSTWYTVQTVDGENTIVVADAWGKLLNIVFDPIPTEDDYGIIKIGDDIQYKDMLKGEYKASKPQPPTNVRAEAIDETSIKVVWDWERGISYKVYKSNTLNGIYEEVSDESTSQTFYLVEGLSYGDVVYDKAVGMTIPKVNEYYFKVSAHIEYKGEHFDGEQSDPTDKMTTMKPEWLDAKNDDRIVFVDGSSFVDSSDDDPKAGTRNKPLATINKALEVVKKNPTKTIIWVSNKNFIMDYDETLDIDIPNRPIIIEGGWLTSNASASIVNQIINVALNIASPGVGTLVTNIVKIGPWEKMAANLDTLEILKVFFNIDISGVLGGVIKESLSDALPLGLGGLASSLISVDDLIKIPAIELGFGTGIGGKQLNTSDISASIIIRPGSRVILRDLKISGTTYRSGNNSYPYNACGILNMGELTIETSSVSGWDNTALTINNSYGIINDYRSGMRTAPKLTVSSGNVTGVSIKLTKDIFGAAKVGQIFGAGGEWKPNLVTKFANEAVGIHNKGGIVIVGDKTSTNTKTVSVYGADLSVATVDGSTSAKDTCAILNEPYIMGQNVMGKGTLTVVGYAPGSLNKTTTVSGIAGLPLFAAQVRNYAIGIKNFSETNIDGAEVYGFTSLSHNLAGLKNTSKNIAYAIWNESYGGSASGAAKVTVTTGVIRGKPSRAQLSAKTPTYALYKNTSDTYATFKKDGSASGVYIQNNPPIVSTGNSTWNGIINTIFGAFSDRDMENIWDKRLDSTWGIN